MQTDVFLCKKEPLFGRYRYNKEAKFFGTYIMHCFLQTHKDGVFNVSTGYMFFLKTFFFLGWILKKSRFFGPRRPLFGWCKYMFGTLF